MKRASRTAKITQKTASPTERRSRKPDTKTKVTVSVSSRLLKQVDEFVAAVSKRNGDISRSAVMDEALRLWKAKLIAEEEEAYYIEAAEEVDKEHRAWIPFSTESIKRLWW